MLAAASPAITSALASAMAEAKGAGRASSSRSITCRQVRSRLLLASFTSRVFPVSALFTLCLFTAFILACFCFCFWIGVLLRYASMSCARFFVRFYQAILMCACCRCGASGCWFVSSTWNAHQHQYRATEATTTPTIKLPLPPMTKGQRGTLTFSNRAVATRQKFWSVNNPPSLSLPRTSCSHLSQG